MKLDSDNFRSSAILDVVESLKKSNVIILYEPLLSVETYENCEVISSLHDFKIESNLVVANKMHSDFLDIMEKSVYTRFVS